ncbi:Aste57867_868 [Aphanomyces stellatus]|uniref:Aste57867_868 protein n=1 Tax=Aphanomyces stellatus TaxID=120398 RepID=A0A485K8Z8_9STRA|nr:hypothetical protein As57867_000867 [Aphanomyces stellatus]VFT78092.1 Aste57867_868 [Aphanomyces stellatus]
MTPRSQLKRALRYPRRWPIGAQIRVEDAGFLHFDNRAIEYKGSMEALQGSTVQSPTMAPEDVTCAICLEPFASPVTLYCGHTFDRYVHVSLSSAVTGSDAHWSTRRECLVNMVEKPCPVCRQGEIQHDVVVQPKNQIVCTAVKFICSHASDAIEARGLGHEHARLTRLATYVPAKSSTSTSMRHTVSLHWGRFLLASQSLVLPWSAMYGPSGIQDDEAEIPCCLQFCSWSTAFTLACSYVVAMILAQSL